MIKRISKIKNIGSFQYFEWDKSNPPYKYDKQEKIEKDNKGNKKEINSNFRKYNIVFGENATGKTHVVKIFKSLNDNLNQFLTKHWDRTNEDREIEIKIEDDSLIIFNETHGWKNNKLSEKFIIFDKSFVESYIHSSKGRNVDHDKNTGSLILYLGNFHIYKQNLDNLDKLRHNLRNKNSDYEDQLQQDFYSLVKKRFQE